MFWSEIGKILGNHQLGFDFHQRSAGTSQEKMELVWRQARLPFRNVGWDRDRSPSQLASQFIGFVPRKCLFSFVAFKFQFFLQAIHKDHLWFKTGQ